MTKTIRAIYENQVLRLLEPLDLKDGQQVQIQVVEGERKNEPYVLGETQAPYVTLVAPEADQDDPGDVVRILTQAGLLVPRPEGPTPPNPLSDEERRAIARRAGRALGKTASEMVIEDRGEW